MLIKRSITIADGVVDYDDLVVPNSDNIPEFLIKTDYWPYNETIFSYKIGASFLLGPDPTGVIPITQPVTYAKVIKTAGNSRAYHKFFVLQIYRIDYMAFYKCGLSLRRRKRTKSSTFYNLDGVNRVLRSTKGNLFDVFSRYVRVTQPILAYYLIRKRSYLKKRKVYINKFTLRIAKDFNRPSKLFHQVKSIFFRHRNRKTAGSLDFSTHNFLQKEFCRPGNSPLFKKKIKIYSVKGHESMNELLVGLVS